MQIDMHYHAILCIAVAAGFSPDSAQQIATASQFVDDNNSDGKKELEFSDGSAFYLVATAHHPLNFKNLNDEEQRTVWVPFHFIPGNEGDSYEERIIATKDSDISREIVYFAQSNMDREFGLQLLGIASHAYADTFSHYGFSGLSSPLNRVHFETILKQGLLPDIEKYIDDKHANFLKTSAGDYEATTHRFFDFVTERVTAGAANRVAALGHGSVHTYPDRPYLSWEFSYEHPRIPAVLPEDDKKSIRHNPTTFFEACEKLHRIFSEAVSSNPNFGVAGEAKPFDSIKAKVREIIDFQGAKPERAQQWVDAYDKGFFNENNAPFPQYLGNDWLEELEEADDAPTAETFLESQVVNFYRAAECYRAFVLRDLLPRNGLAVK
jgi:hypothetical protein